MIAWRRHLPMAVVLLLGLASVYLAMGNLPFHLPRFPLYSEPGGVERVEGVITSEVFTSPAELPVAPPSQRVLWGALAAVQSMSAAQLQSRAVALLALFACGALLLRWPRRRTAALAIALSALVLLSLLASLRLSAGWDEFYINLKHAQNVIDHGTYSLNVGEHIESTVDLLPFMAAGVLAKLTGIIPDNFAFAFSFLGNILIITVGFAFARRLTGSDAGSLAIAAFLAVFPPLIYVGASGFMATLFAGCIVGAFYLLLEGRGRWRFGGYVALGLLPLVRIEGVALGLLAWGGSIALGVWVRRTEWRRLWRWMQRSWRIFAWRLVAVLLPFLLVGLARRAFFGFAIPIPVLFKNSKGDFDYLLNGTLQLREYYDIFSLGPLLLVAALPMALLIVGRRRYAVAYVALSLFSVTYLLGGGDWFPGRWARYWVPLLAFSVVLAASAVHNAFVTLRVRRAPWVLAAALLLFVATQVNKRNSAFADAVFQLRKGGNGWERVDALARLGDHLGRTSDSTWRIGSPEVATMMFFAHRDVVGLLGVDNPDVALAPLAPMKPGDRLHRRRWPETLESRKPELLALYEPAVKNRPFSTLDRLQVDVHSYLLTRYMQDVGYYRVGSYDYLQALGYRSLTVQAGHALFTYWVHQSVWPAHRDRLLAAGFAPRGAIQVPYHIDARLTRRLRPAGTRLAALHGLPRDAVASVASVGDIETPPMVPRVGPFRRQATYSSWNGRDGQGTVRMRLGASQGPGELRVPLALGPDASAVTMYLADAASHAKVQDIAVPQGLTRMWLTLRVVVPLASSPLELVVTDAGAGADQWFAVATPWWMGAALPPVPASREASARPAPRPGVAP